MMHADKMGAFYQLLSKTLKATPKMISYSFLVTSMPALGATILHGHQYLDPTACERRTQQTDYMCSEEELTIINTFFEQSEIHKATRMHPTPNTGI
jgi:hypothetical protein